VAEARRFEGKVVVVTGAAGGIGRATALRFASEGASVVLVDLTEAGLAPSLAAVEGTGTPGLAVSADVTKAADVERCVAAATARFGGVDCLFNNAGILGAVAPLFDYPEETFDRVMAINAKGVWLGMKVVGPAIRARGGGAIVNTASTAGLRGTPRLAAYVASKHAVVGLTRAAALELARHNIRVNAICPSTVETPMARALETGVRPTDPAEARDRLVTAIPMRRYGAPEEIAALVAFLCSDEARYITGAIYPVDGGLMA